MSGGMQGKVALVTGAGSGIGRASAVAFAREGAKVVVADLDGGAGAETVGLITAAGGDATCVPVDVSQATEVAAMVDQAVAIYGRLDIAHNNAGVFVAGVMLHEHREENWDRLISINLKGVWLCMKYEIGRMLAQGGGAIVNTASVAGLVGSRGAAAYIASKHGVVGLTKAAALEYAPHGIRVNVVCPGFVQTPMLEYVTGGDAEREAALSARMPIGRVARPEEIAASAVWLCSDAASYVTGHALAIDGGYVAQ